ncbi:MAG: aspartate aminotransferase family protein, partial [Algoriphagus sp.]|nr:aspartate aminotransferase family protein [Algoriphagus sp.]
MNIVTIHAEAISAELAHKYNLVPKSHDESNEWYKIVLMDHVEIEHLKDFIQDLISSKNLNPI